MICLASRLGADNIVCHDHPLTKDELAQYIPTIFSEDKKDLNQEDV